MKYTRKNFFNDVEREVAHAREKLPSNSPLALAFAEESGELINEINL